ncbi:MAG: GNAT family N-acetyltransferase [Defluviitaleaceae bacterium]|nr:GNAT family N-acetyltransferase [Defluviitaleaceae bacterium]
MNSPLEVTVSKGNNPVYEVMFDDLIQEVFGFSFVPWLEEELWDERYESYSIIEDGRMLSNVCIFKSDMIVSGETVKAIQFGAIATRKEMRGKGLSQQIMEHILSLYPNTLAYLSANPSVIDFYPRFGFRQIQKYKPEIAVNINNSPNGAIKYELDDSEFTFHFNKRGVFSNMVDYLNSQSIQMFHLLMEYEDDIFYLPELNTLVIAQQDGNRLLLADVIAKKPITFEQLKEVLPFEGVEIVEFGFCPDWLGVTPTWVSSNMNEDPFFIKGDWKLPEFYRFPIMSET